MKDTQEYSDFSNGIAKAVREVMKETGYKFPDTTIILIPNYDKYNDLDSIIGFKCYRCEVPEITLAIPSDEPHGYELIKEFREAMLFI